jgi:hypothetical protein
MAAKTCAEYMEQQRSNGRYNISYDEVWDAAIKLVEEKFTSTNSAMDAIAIIDSAISDGWFNFDRTRGYDALVAVRKLLQQHQ